MYYDWHRNRGLNECHGCPSGSEYSLGDAYDLPHVEGCFGSLASTVFFLATKTSV